jgi:two-component system sensor histidine kinase MprB
MSFRTRLALVAAAAVGIAVVVASVVVFVVVHNEPFGEVDRALHNRAVEIANGPQPEIENGYLHIPGPHVGVQSDFVQAVPLSGGPYVEPDAAYKLPVNEKDHEAARGEQPLYYSNRHFQGTEFRVLTIPATPYAVQIARPLGEVNRTLHRITLFLILIAVGGIGVAAALGLLVSRAALAPVRRLTETTEAVTETRDLSQRIESTRPATTSSAGSRRASTRCSRRSRTRAAQRQLVADASHELRTPLTSLKTNIEVLARENELTPERAAAARPRRADRRDDRLIGELIELAREARPDAVVEPARDVRLDLVAADAIERTRRNRPGVGFETDLDESIVYGAPSTIERAVANLLDNAAKWSPPGGQVEVAVRQGELSVRDHGPWIADEDLPYVFDRFYRSRTARGLPGSGLGLAIVKQVAESQGGSVVAERPQDGGTLMRLRLNGKRSGS